MSKTTSAIMKSHRARITRYERMVATACGHEENVQKAYRFRAKMEFELEQQIERIVQQAKLP